MRPLLLALAGVALAGCPGGKGTTRPTSSPDVRAEVARLEALRGAGVDGLIARAASGAPGARDLALRGLGRVGGPRALDALVAALDDPDPAIATRAAAAIGVLAATTDPPPPVITRVSGALLATLGRGKVGTAAVIEALGRAGDASALAPLAGRVASPDPAIAEAAAIALGRYGRRDLDLDGATRAALIEAIRGASPEVRHAAVWALGREHRADPPRPDPAVTSALIAAVADPDAETRAAAIAAIAKRKAVADADSQIEQAMRDPDWRVAVEAVRALGGDAGTDPGRDAVGAIMVRAWALQVGGAAPSHIHVLLEGLRALAGAAARPAVRDALAALASAASTPTDAVSPLVRGWVRCLATAALERAEPDRFDGGTRLLGCGDELAPHLRAGLLAELIKAGVGPVARRRDAIVVLLAASDPHRRAAGLEAMAAAWASLDPGDQEALVPALTRALAGDATDEVGAAADTAGALLARTDLIATARAPIATALIERAGRETDGELAASLLGAIATGKLADGQAVCEHAAAAAPPVIRVAGRDCVTVLAGGTAPDPARVLDEPAAAAAPALDLSTVVGHRITWTVETTRGKVTIALEPDVAPWHVAAITDLTRRGFYNGLVFHRVVPDFVVQGGDPTGTGWGGPGYTLPSEPGTRLDGDDYRAGAVGIADAGKDSGGSQWFVMHSRAPHLEGRYTRIGRVVAGQEVVDALVVGDAIVKATIAVE